jgi:ATP phosphoribosyltransferase
MMRFAKVFVLSVLLLAFPLKVTFAKDFPAPEIAELQTAVNGFDAAMRANDMKSILSVMPPKVWGYLKEKSKLDDAQLMQVVGDALAAAMKDVKLLDFKMDVAAATTHELSDGTSYMLLPTVTKMEIKDYGKVAAISQTLALREDGKWYLIRVSDPQQKQIVTTVYPAFNGVELPSDKLEDIKE